MEHTLHLCNTKYLVTTPTLLPVVEQASRPSVQVRTHPTRRHRGGGKTRVDRRTHTHDLLCMASSQWKIVEIKIILVSYLYCNVPNVLLYYPRAMEQCALNVPSQLPGEYTTQAAVSSATRLSFE